jgi:hypothetical protein
MLARHQKEQGGDQNAGQKGGELFHCGAISVRIEIA